MSTDSFGGLAGVRQRVKPCQRATSALVHQGNHRQSISLSGQQCDRHTFTRKPVILSPPARPDVLVLIGDVIQLAA